MSENKHTTLGQMRDFAQRQDARDDQQEEQLAQHEEELGGVVKYTEQTLTDEQKAQARTNIGAVNDYNNLDNIPCGETTEPTDTVSLDLTDEEIVNSCLNGYMYRISEVAPSYEDLVNGGSYTESTPYEDEKEQVRTFSQGTVSYAEGAYALIGNGLVSIIYDPTYFGEGATKGTWVTYTDNGDGTFSGATSLTINNFSGYVTKKVTKMPEKFLPESVESVILRSSTAGSTKKFKLTVDDSGAITATEVS